MTESRSTRVHHPFEASAPMVQGEFLSQVVRMPRPCLVTRMVQMVQCKIGVPKEISTTTHLQNSTVARFRQMRSQWKLVSHHLV